jgi:hypothetical protein
MKRLRIAAVLLLTGLLGCALRATTLSASGSAAQELLQQPKREVTVWVNTRSGVYHCPGSRWDGKTKQGRYMCECEALRDGYRPAYGRPCGSDCGRSSLGASTAECALQPAQGIAQPLHYFKPLRSIGGPDRDFSE